MNRSESHEPWTENPRLKDINKQIKNDAIEEFFFVLFPLLARIASSA